MAREGATNRDAPRHDGLVREPNEKPEIKSMYTSEELREYRARHTPSGATLVPLAVLGTGGFLLALLGLYWEDFISYGLLLVAGALVPILVSILITRAERARKAQASEWTTSK